jgi:ABC-type molybdate transport system permease subunit
MPIIETTPILTAYRSGLVNLNLEATRVLPSSADALLLLPPARLGAHWILIPGIDGVCGDVRLVGRADRGNVRFRAPAFVASLFAALPLRQDTLRLAMEPVLTSGWRLVAQ